MSGIITGTDPTTKVVNPVGVVGNALMVTGGGGAAGAAATGMPTRAAGVARTANTAVTNGQTSEVTMTLNGAQVTKAFSIPELDWQFACAAGGIINTTDVAAKASAGAGVRNYVTGMTLSNANATATEFVIKDGATVIWRGNCPANMPTVPITFTTPLRGTAATAINVACLTTAAQVYCSLQGYAGT